MTAAIRRLAEAEGATYCQLSTRRGKEVAVLRFSDTGQLEAFFINGMIDQPFRGYASKAIGSTLLIWKR